MLLLERHPTVSSGHVGAAQDASRCVLPALWLLYGAPGVRMDCQEQKNEESLHIQEASR